jgi:hypothetical protein
MVFLDTADVAGVGNAGQFPLGLLGLTISPPLVWQLGMQQASSIDHIKCF